ncbi:hypothetical protein [Rossellomorea marisflavi]|uniref:hypothetical protein n=1 Tax=Rossellomorea marisflavi TaxID=189381 RepID=UPI003D2EEDAA
MSFRFDMRGKSVQQQSIVRQREDNNKLIKESTKPSFDNQKKCNKEELTWEVASRISAYDGIAVKCAGATLFYLCVTRVALATSASGLSNLDGDAVNEWLFDTAKKISHEVEEGYMYFMKDENIKGGELVVSWDLLDRASIDELGL